MKPILYISLIFLTLGTFASCSNDISMGDKELETKKPPVSLPGDIDGDGILDENDNCPTLANADQADGNSNGLGDVCEDLECSSNFCQDGEFLSGRHCDGEVSVLCGVNSEGCLEVVSRIDCVAGCQTSGDQAGECTPKPRDLTDPVINDATGSRSHGSTITLTGEDFGEHDLNIEWTGDRIENETVGVNPDTWPNWDHIQDGGGLGETDHITSSISWSGDKCADLTVDQQSPNITTNSAASRLSYLFPQGKNWNKIYVTYWYRIHGVHTSDGQISSKHLWLTSRSPNGNNIYPFANPRNAIKSTINIMETGLPTKNESIINAFQGCPGLDNPSSWEPWHQAIGVGYDHRGLIGGATQASNNHNRGAFAMNNSYIQNFAPHEDEWVRMVYYWDYGTPDTPNGESYHATIRPGGQSGAGQPDAGLWIGTWAQNVLMHSTRTDCGDNVYDYPDMLGWYLFTATPPGPQDKHTEYWIDDIYIQFDTRSRVEIGDAANYEDCTKLEIQNPEAWSDNEIKIQLNHGGSFKSGDKAYIFVINENEYDQGDRDAYGNGHYDFAGVSPGYPITLE